MNLASEKAKAVQSREETGPPFAGREVNQIQHTNHKSCLVFVNGNEKDVSVSDMRRRSLRRGLLFRHLLVPSCAGKYLFFKAGKGELIGARDQRAGGPFELP